VSDSAFPDALDVTVVTDEPELRTRAGDLAIA
jgi:hypothetical protein